MKTIRFDEIDSTNTYCKLHDDGQDVIVTADRQTAGRGTKGRSFISDEGGLYVTVMRHDVCDVGQTFTIMINSCVAVCQTLEHFGIRPTIKWPNDVLVGGKKICGTLIENTFRGNRVSRSIVGMGLNVGNRLPNELKEIGTTMADHCQAVPTVAEVRDELIKNLQKTFDLSIYQQYIDWFGKPVRLLTAAGERIVTAEAVLPNGNLLCSDGTSQIVVSAGEVSLRI